MSVSDCLLLLNELLPQNNKKDLFHMHQFAVRKCLLSVGVAAGNATFSRFGM